MRDKISLAVASLRAKFAAMRKEDRAQFGLRSIFTIVGTLLGAVIAVELLGGFADPFFDSLADFVGVYTSDNTTTNSTTADELLPTLGLVAAIVGPLALLGLAIGAMTMNN